MIRVQIANGQTAVRIDRRRLSRAVRMVLRREGIREAEVSLALVDDAAMRRLNRRFLGRDEPTDVLSFLLERRGERLEGEIVASGETARRVARQYGWSAAGELLLYVIHGALHLAGWTDATPKQRSAMEERQRSYLAPLALRSSLSAAP